MTLSAALKQNRCISPTMADTWDAAIETWRYTMDTLIYPNQKGYHQNCSLRNPKLMQTFDQTCNSHGDATMMVDMAVALACTVRYAAQNRHGDTSKQTRQAGTEALNKLREDAAKQEAEERKKELMEKRIQTFEKGTGQRTQQHQTAATAACVRNRGRIGRQPKN